MKTPPCIHVHKYQVSLHTHSNQSRLLSATSHTLSLALLRLLLLLGKLAVGDRCGKTFPPARASYYVLNDVSKSQLQVSFDSPPPFPRDAKSGRFSRYICAIFAYLPFPQIWSYHVWRRGCPSSCPLKPFIQLQNRLLSVTLLLYMYLYLYLREQEQCVIKGGPIVSTLLTM